MWSNSSVPVSRQDTGTLTACLTPSARSVNTFVIGTSEKQG